MILSNDFCRVRIGGSESEQIRSLHPDKRSWWVSTDGTIYDSGYDHNLFMKDRPDVFNYAKSLDDAVNSGWLRVGSYGGQFTIGGNRLTPRQIEAAQKIYRSLGPGLEIFVELATNDGYLDEETFLTADTNTDINRNLLG